VVVAATGAEVAAIDEPGTDGVPPAVVPVVADDPAPAFADVEAVAGFEILLSCAGAPDAVAAFWVVVTTGGAEAAIFEAVAGVTEAMPELLGTAATDEGVTLVRLVIAASASALAAAAAAALAAAISAACK
jgi:hypothetical protein